MRPGRRGINYSIGLRGINYAIDRRGINCAIERRGINCAIERYWKRGIATVGNSSYICRSKPAREGLYMERPMITFDDIKALHQRMETLGRCL